MVSSGSTKSVWPLELVAVDHAVELAPLSGDDRDDEALVADGDELLLEDAFLAVGAQEALERFLNGLLLPLDVAAQAVERDAGVVGDACRRAGSCRRGRCSSARKSPMVARARAEQREALGGGGEDATWRRRRGRAGRRGRRFPWARGWRLRCAACGRRAAVSGRPPKSMRMAAPRAAGCGRAARRRYSMASPLSARSCRRRSRSLCGWSFVQLAPAHGARDVAADQLPQRFEFEDFRGGFQARLLILFSAFMERAFQYPACAETRSLGLNVRSTGLQVFFFDCLSFRV